MLLTKKEFLVIIIVILLSITASKVYFDSIIIYQAQKIEILTKQLADKNFNAINTAVGSSPQTNTVVGSPRVATLTQQVKQLTKQIIEKDNQLDELKELTAVQNPAVQSKREQWLGSPEYIKSAMIPASVLPVVDELTIRLALSTLKRKELSTLLQAKAEADHDTMKPYLDELNKNGQAGYDAEKLASLNELVNSQLVENQELYGDQLEGLLNSEQLANYQQLENEKTQKNTDRMINYQTAELSMAISTLDDYQKTQIKELYQNSYKNTEDTPLGVSGSIYAKRVNSIDSEQFQNRQIILEQLLTNEQLETYKNYQQSLIE